METTVQRSRYAVGLGLLLVVVVLWTGSNFVTQVNILVMRHFRVQRASLLSGCLRQRFQ